MRLNWTALPLLGLALLTNSAVAANSNKPFSPDDLVRLARVSDPQVSPDGKHVVFALRETDIEANRGKVDLWLLNLNDERPVSRRLTQHPASDSSGRWAPDGRGIYFLSSRSGSSQVWHISLEGGEAQQVTSLPLDVGSFEVSPRGDRLAVSLEVFPDCVEIKCTTDRLAERKKDKASAKSYDALFVRHWDTWNDGTLSRLFTATIGSDRKAGEFKLISGAVRGHVPSKPFGGEEDYTFSPDGQRIVFSARIADAKEPWSTNFDLYEVAADGTGETRNLTTDNPAWDAQPVFLANGDLAWLAMSRPGFEADRYVVMLRSGVDGKTRALTADWDRSVGHIAASFDGRKLIATADDVGQTALVEIDPKSGYRQRLLGNGQVQAYSPTRDGVVIALDWPVILEAAELTRLGRHRDLIELDQNYPVRRAGRWTEASFRVGRRQLSRLKACRDLRVVQRYLAAVEDGQAHAWNPIVFGVALAAFHLPYRSGLLHYASTLLRGFAERCRPRNVPLADWTVWVDSLEAPLPEAVQRLLPSAFTALGAPSRAVGS